jgi:hypothetical protein
MNRLCDCDEEDKECRQNFDAETSWERPLVRQRRCIIVRWILERKVVRMEGGSI